jgi:hypothetical protein
MMLGRTHTGVIVALPGKESLPTLSQYDPVQSTVRVEAFARLDALARENTQCFAYNVMPYLKDL